MNENGENVHVDDKPTAHDDIPATSSNNVQPKNVLHVDGLEHTDLPPFWCHRAQLWFTSIEALFANRKITSDATKYFAVVARLDHEVLAAVEHLVLDPPPTNKYQSIKESLLERFSVSQEKRFKTLVTGLELAGRRPSDLLTEMQRLGGSTLDAAFIRTMWMERLPQNVKIALAAAEGLSNTKLAQLADRIMDIQSSSSNHQVSAISTKDGRPNNGNPTSQLLESLCQKLDKLISLQQPRSRSRSFSRRQDTKQQEKICFYHRKFGSKANKCTQPCAWLSNNATKTEN